jgi:hypothetical protein
MRCLACNKNLNDFESTRKDSEGHYLDLCNHCYHSVQSDIQAVEERHDLRDGDDEIFGDDSDDWIELDFDLDQE